MSKIEVEELTVFEKLDLVLSRLYFEINDIQPIKLYTLEEVEKMKTEDIEAIIGSIDVFKTEQEIRDRMFTKIDKNKQKYKKEHSELFDLMQDVKKESRKYYLELINKKVQDENEEIKKGRNKLKSTIGKLQDVVYELKRDKVDIEKVYKSLD